jgi:hypothetical protein
LIENPKTAKKDIFYQKYTISAMFHKFDAV